VQRRWFLVRQKEKPRSEAVTEWDRVWSQQVTRAVLGRHSTFLGHTLATAMSVWCLPRCFGC
jgi:hypothetical protein